MWPRNPQSHVSETVLSQALARLWFPCGQHPSLMVTGGNRGGDESVGPSTYSGTSQASSCFAQRSLLSSFEDQPKPLLKRPLRGRVLPAPGQRQGAPRGTSGCPPLPKLLFQELILVTRGASGRGRSASRQGSGSLRQQGSSHPCGSSRPTRPSSLRPRELLVSRTRLCRNRLRGSTTPSLSRKTDGGSGGGPSQGPRAECHHEPKTESGSEQAPRSTCQFSGNAGGRGAR